MALSPQTKLKIKPGQLLLPLQAPAEFPKLLGKLPAGTSLEPGAKKPDQIHWFVKTKAEFEKGLDKLMKLIGPATIAWIYFPKGSSGIQTDLSRDKGWDKLMKQGDKLTWISLVSFDETWSVFGIRLSSEGDKKKQIKAAPVREILNWIDPAKKTVTLPSDLSITLNKNKKALAFFESLSFTNKKEYLEWIVTAKKEETRSERISGTIERLLKSWKNPRNT